MKLFAYWHTRDLTPLVAKCLENWRKTNTNFEVVLCCPDNMDTYLDPGRPSGFDQLSIAAQSDWIRVALVAKYGGAYCDASTVFTEAIDKWCDSNADINAFVSFDQRIMPFFFACFNRLDLVNLWLKEATIAVEEGVESYTARQNSYLDLKIKSYFWVQLALARVLNDSSKQFHLNLFYDKNILPSINQMARSKPEAIFKLVKLNHHKRDWLETYLLENEGNIDPESIISWFNHYI